MKNIYNYTLVKIVFLTIISCNQPDNGCLPYEGEIYGSACNGLIIKVTNKEINSFMESGKGVVNNVLVARFPDNIEVDSTIVASKIYFDFRELRQSEENICPQATAEPNLKVYITSFSLTKCE